VIAALRAKGLWQIVLGNDPKPTVHSPTGTNAAEIKEDTKDLLDWLNNNDKANGLISANININLRSFVDKSAKTTWDNLKVQFDKPEPVNIYNLFTALCAWSFDARDDPDDQTRSWTAINDRLVTAFHAYSAQVQTFFQTKEEKDLNVSALSKVFVTVWQQRQGARAFANKLSAVPRRGPDPQHRPAKLIPDGNKPGYPSGSPRNGQAPTSGSFQPHQVAGQFRKTKHSKRAGKKKSKQAHDAHFMASNIVDAPSLAARLTSPPPKRSLAARLSSPPPIQSYNTSTAVLPKVYGIIIFGDSGVITRRAKHTTAAAMKQEKS
ncbi:hypothetical protein CPB83DRAFT_896862, partial [Crepidotus variabilis]